MKGEMKSEEAKIGVNANREDKRKQQENKKRIFHQVKMKNRHLTVT